MKRRADNIETAGQKRTRVEPQQANVGFFDAVANMVIHEDILLHEILPRVFRARQWEIRAWASTCKRLSMVVYSAIRHTICVLLPDTHSDLADTYTRALYTVPTLAILHNHRNCGDKPGALAALVASPALRELYCHDLPVSVLVHAHDLRALSLTRFSVPLKTAKSLYTLRNLETLIVRDHGTATLATMKIAPDMARFAAAMPKLRTLIIKNTFDFFADAWLDALSTFRSLTALTACTLPPNMAGLSGLTSLELIRHHSPGNTNDALPALDSLTALRTLKLVYYPVLPAACFATMPNLTKLTLIDSNMEGASDVFRGATALCRLRIKTFLIPWLFALDADVAASLPHLERLSLRNIHVNASTLRLLAATLRNLKLRDVNRAFRFHIPANTPPRMALMLQQQMDAAPQAPEDLMDVAALTRLEKLDVRNTGIQWGGLRAMHKLRKLVYHRLIKSEEDWPGLAVLPSLTHCTIRTLYSAHHQSPLDMSSPTLLALRIGDDSGARDTGANAIPVLPRVTFLALHSRYICDTQMQLSTLTALDLSSGKMSLGAPAAFAALTSLITLSIAYNHAVPLSSVARITSLQVLNAYGAGHVHGEEREACVRQLRQLRRLYVSFYDTELTRGLNTLPDFELLGVQSRRLFDGFVTRAAYAIINYEDVPLCFDDTIVRLKCDNPVRLISDLLSEPIRFFADHLPVTEKIRF